MKTKCYCVFCPKHPLFKRQAEFSGKRIAGWHSNMFMPLSFAEEAGADVTCLDPKSDAFYELNIEPEDHEFKTTAYGDGGSETGFSGMGYEIDAYCGNETYEELK